MKFVCTAAMLCATLCAGVPEFRLTDTNGATHTPAEWKQYKAIVLYFVTTDCPVANSYVPEMNRIRADYAARGVAMYAVQAETAVPAADVAKYAKDFQYSYPLLLDPSQTLVEMVNATVTPQAAVLTPDGKLQYLGRVDNRVEDFGKRRPQATQSELRLALDAVLTGKPVAEPRTKSIGCAINRIHK